MMINSFFCKRPSLPVFHTRGRHRDPIYASGAIGNESTHFLKTVVTEKLARSRNVVLSFETIFPRIIPFLNKRCPGNSELRIILKFLEQESQVIRFKRH